MKKKPLLLLVILVIVALGATACRRAASTPPPTPPTEAGGFPVPGTQTMGIFDTFATQTAMALEQGGAAPQDTPEPPAQEAEEPAPSEPEPAPPTQEEHALPLVPVQPEPTQPPAPTEPPVVPTATPGIPATHTLQKGEHVYCLARRYNVNPAELLNLNGLGVNTVLQPGRELRIPQTGNTFPSTRALQPHPASYTVRSGDTIYSIACAFGDADPNAIIAANNLEPPYNLTAGQTIHIP
jgi:LysM repeat protein